MLLLHVELSWFLIDLALACSLRVGQVTASDSYINTNPNLIEIYRSCNFCQCITLLSNKTFDSFTTWNWFLIDTTFACSLELIANKSCS